MTNSSDNDLDLLLAELRDTQPSPGFEQRLLTTMEQLPPSAPSRSWFWPVAIACACAATVIAVTILPRATHDLASPAQPSPHAVTQSSTPDTVATTAPETQSHAIIHSVHSIATPPQPRTDAPASSMDDVALAETLAPSRPAPPMPLTRDERLLLRAARHTDEVTVAQLEALPRPSLRWRDAAITQFLQRNLASLAVAESFHPTPPQEQPQALSQPETPPSQPDAPQ